MRATGVVGRGFVARQREMAPGMFQLRAHPTRGRDRSEEDDKQEMGLVG